MDEYQKKRLTEFSFRKWQIPKDMFLGAHLAVPGMRLQKRKAAASSRTPHGVIYSVKYTGG
jgi:hypothetical protein